MHHKFVPWLGALALSAAAACPAQQVFTPFAPPPPVPAEGQPFHKDDPAYPKYLEIYDEIQKNFGSESALQPTAKAINDLQQAYPASPYPLFALAEYRYALFGQDPRGNSEALAIVERAMRMDGADIPDGYILKAKLYADQQYPEAALREAGIAVRFAPDKAEAQFALGRAEDVSGHYAEAEAAYRKFISLVDEPRRKANGYTWLGHSLSDPNLPRALRSANHAKAVEAMRMSLELRWTQAHAMYYADYLLDDIGDIDAAAVQLKKILAQDGTDDEARFAMGMAEYLNWARTNPKGQHAVALEAIRKKWGVSKEDAFAYAARHEALETVVLTMLEGRVVKDINQPCSDSCPAFPPGASALDNAAYADGADLSKRLIERGAAIDTRDGQGRTPLMYALLNENDELAGYLLGKGADANARAVDGATPLEIAISRPASSKKTISMLLMHRADPASPNSTGVPLAIDAITRKNPDALVLLLKSGAVDVNLKERRGYPLLYFALRNPDMVRLLLDNGADPWVQIGDQDLMTFAPMFSEESGRLIQEARDRQPKNPQPKN